MNCVHISAPTFSLNMLFDEAFSKYALLFTFSLGDDKVSIHVNLYIPTQKIERGLYNHQADSPFYMWPDVCSVKLQA